MWEWFAVAEGARELVGIEEWVEFTAVAMVQCENGAGDEDRGC